MKILEYKEEYREALKDLFVELQEYIVSIDKYKLNVIEDNYREVSFIKTLQEVNEYNGKIYLAIDNNQVLGAIVGYVETYNEDEKLGYACPKKGIICELIVSKNSRRGGVGNALLNKIEEYFISINCEYIQLEVFSYNEMAKNFYSKNDYESRCITLFKKI